MAKVINVGLAAEMTVSEIDDYFWEFSAPTMTEKGRTSVSILNCMSVGVAASDKCLCKSWACELKYCENGSDNRVKLRKMKRNALRIEAGHWKVDGANITEIKIQWQKEAW